MLSSSIYRKHSTARRAWISPAHSSIASTRRSQRNNASKRTELARASASSSIYTDRCALQTNREIEPFPAYDNIQPLSCLAGGVMSEGFAFVSSQDTTLVFLSVLSISYMHAASGLFSWSMELLAFASRQFAPKIVDLSVRFIRFFFFAIFFLVSERSGRWKPPAEGRALYCFLLYMEARG